MESSAVTQPDNLKSIDADAPRDLFWTPSNVVSLLRVPLTVAALYLIWLGPDYRLMLFAVMFAAIVTDIGDGALARRRGEVTRWGKILDPMADKVAIDSIAVALVVFGDLPPWVAVVVVGRDLLILLAGIFVIARTRFVFSSNIWGKLTTITMSALLLTYAMGADPLKTLLLWSAGALLVASMVSYGMYLIRFLRGDGV
jgi:CDP-diacylglycerol--glycerol-3-phosphate 3-phosphatidyltransferase